MAVIAILIGRGGSKGFPGKNTCGVLGRPLMTYPLLAARHARSVDRVYVSTDSESIKEVARNLGAIVLGRPPELCTDSALGEDVFADAYRQVCPQGKEPLGSLDAVALLFCNAPTLTSKTIDEAVMVLQGDPLADSVVTVSRYNMWSPLRARRLDSEGFLKPFVPFEVFGDPARINCDRDSQGDVWFADMALSVVRPPCLERMESGLLPQRWMGTRIRPLPNWGGLDVDYEWQIPQVEFWLRKHGFSETSTPYDS